MKPVCQRGCDPFAGCQSIHFLHMLAFDGCLVSSALLSWWLHHSSLHLHLHFAFSSVCLCQNNLCLFIVGIHMIAFRARLDNSGETLLKILNMSSHLSSQILHIGSGESKVNNILGSGSVFPAYHTDSNTTTERLRQKQNLGIKTCYHQRAAIRPTTPYFLTLMFSAIRQ